AQIHHESVLWAWFTLLRHPMFIVEAVPVGVGAHAEHLHVLLGAPVGAAQFVRGAEPFAARDVDKGHRVRNSAAKVGEGGPARAVGSARSPGPGGAPRWGGHPVVADR